VTALLDRIVSGGQTGVDRGALDAAIEAGIAHGGWCPRERRAEDGRIPDRYRLTEVEAHDYVVRTERNVVDSDATLVLAVGQPRNGTALTCRLARQHRKPCLIVDLDRPVAPEEVRTWIAAEGVRVLNVAGPRESSHPGVQERAAGFMRRVLACAREE
jgi:hypothetical protein